MYVVLAAQDRHDDVIDGSQGLTATQRRRRRQRMRRRMGRIKQKRIQERLPSWLPTPCYSNSAEPTVNWLGTLQLFRSTKDPLSNFYPCKLVFREREFKSLEHAYQTAKAWCGDNEWAARVIMRVERASTAKMKSKLINLSPEQWERWYDHRVAIMRELLEHKYQQCKEFREALNPSKVFVEATMDDFWAAGAMKYQLKQLRTPAQIEGTNTMGSLLTELARNGTLRSPAGPTKI